MTTLNSPESLKELLGYNDAVKELNGEVFEDLYNRLRGGERELELDFDTLKELFELVREGTWTEASNPAFYIC